MLRLGQPECHTNVRMQQLTATIDTNRQNLLFCIFANLIRGIELRSRRRCCGAVSRSAFSLAEPVSGVYKDLLRMHVEHQPAVVNLRAVILFMRRIWAGNNAGRIMRVASAGWISS